MARLYAGRDLERRYAPWHFLNFLPEPHQQGSLRPTFWLSSLTTVPWGCAARAGGGASAVAVAPAPAAAIASAPAVVSCAYWRFPFGSSVGCSCAALDVDLRVEEREDDLLADRPAEVFEHDVPLGAILDERILLGHRAQVDTVAQVVHGVEVSSPAGVDDLEDHDALELAHQLRAELLLLLGVRVERVLDELFGERVAVELDLLLELVQRDVGAVQALHLLHAAVRDPSPP